ncbi:MAG: prepilin peptidase [Gammaproteobacteria bacterium]|jgi:leader peptidase (prepilin peptidase) / N-methyltransferase|nr:prepilin peptidase [Gammaproteobacteria bacterium]MBT5603001.1 prepilin peptidase [Gammaproteobacteria bacterium]
MSEFIGLLIQLHQQYPAATYGICLIFGLIIGSFLNVVVHRLPIMLKQAWQTEARLLLDQNEPVGQGSAKYNLVTPRSACPACGQPISALHNIPVISYLLLKGRCRHCQAAISLRYPLLELTTGIATIIVIMLFGPTEKGLLACLLTYALIALSQIDFETKLLPDDITLPMLWLGLIVNSSGIFTDLKSALLGAVLGYLALWTVYQGFRIATGKEGMGFGDFKLLALLGAWLGWQALPFIILISSILGTLVGVTLILMGRDRNDAIPFGPYLAAAGWISLLWGDLILSRYLQVLNVS